MAAFEFEGWSQVLMSTLELEEIIADEESTDEKIKLIEAHIKKVEANHDPVKIPDIPKDFHWINTTTPLNFKTHLRGKIVILDFFTYCCINCLHILPYLAAIESKFNFEDGVVIIGVHSGKFENERLLENIEKAVQRYEIKHPVINDSDCWLWNKLGISCWPTVIITGPEGQILFVFIGEGQKDNLHLYTETTLKYYASQQRISSDSLPVATSCPLYDTAEKLYFPTKLSINETGELLAVSDTGNNRILIIDQNGFVEECIGGRTAGFCDGNFEGARFHSPQGIAWINSKLLCVADTENHALREVNLGTKLVRTLVARKNKEGIEHIGTLNENQIIDSPWDVHIGSINESDEVKVIFIAMAGSHQIWAYFLQNGRWSKQDYPEGTCVPIAGSGKEENRNNSYPHKAAFAQPSGVTTGLVNNQPQLFIADSESSSIRMMSLTNGCVKGVVGGDKDPQNLFSFGDIDGIQSAAKLQHPLGVSWNRENNCLYVADSYNHKIKVIDTTEKSCKTIAGSGKPGSRIDEDLFLTEFNEPNGLAVSPCGSVIYITDTNNHSIRILDLKEQRVKEFPVKWKFTKNPSSALPTNKSVNRRKVTERILLQTVTLKKGGRLLLTPKLIFDDGLELNSEAPNSSNIFVPDLSQLLTKTIPHPHKTLPSHELTASTDAVENSITNIEIELTFYTCNKQNGCCWMKTIVFEVPILINCKGEQQLSVNLEYYMTLNITNGNKH